MDNAKTPITPHTSTANGLAHEPAFDVPERLTRVPFLTVVIPAYNEEKRLPTSLEQVLNYLNARSYNSEVIIVDDGSSDATTAVVQRLMSQAASDTDNNLCELKLIANEHRGKGFAVRTGMLAGQGDYILYSDADLSTPIADVEKLLAWLEDGYDIAAGSREGTEARRYDEPFYRHFMGRVFNLLVRVLTQSSLQDTQCGFKAFRREACHDLFRRVRLYGDNAALVKGALVTGFDVEVLFLARKHNYRVKEVPVVWYHVPGSKVNPLKDSVRMFLDIVKVRWYDLRGKYKDD